MEREIKRAKRELLFLNRQKEEIAREITELQQIRAKLIGSLQETLAVYEILEEQIKNMNSTLTKPK